MGRPSNRRRSAQRPGKRERARVKKPRRGRITSFVGGAGTYSLTAGRKHLGRHMQRVDRILEAHLSGNRAALSKTDEPGTDGHSTDATGQPTS